MKKSDGFVDIHCHLLPSIDDGAKDWEETLAMARLACEDGTDTIIATPHQLGNFAHNHGNEVRQRVREVQQFLQEHQVPLQVLAGGDVRIEDGLAKRIAAGEVMTLADRGRHVLLELPHELYFPLQPVLQELAAAGLQGILSHPERNQGLLAKPELLPGLVDAGCLMQVTSGSLVGSFGPTCQRFAESMLSDGLVHFLASDGHSSRNRRPRMGRSFRRAAELVGPDRARELCCDHPRQVALGGEVPAGRRRPQRTSSISRWFRRTA